MFTKFVRLIGAAALMVLVAEKASAGKIVAANDEWHTTNFGFTQTAAGSTQFALNVAQWFAGAPSGGNFLVLSDNSSLDPNQATTLRNTIQGAGHTWTLYSGIGGFTLNLATLLGFQGVFLALPPAVNNTLLIDYVNAGGNVYIAAGTGVGGAAAEAAAWNPFLNAFGLQYGSVYNGISGNIAITNPSAHPVLNGVASLYQNNGNSLSVLGGNPNAAIIQSLNGQGLYAVFAEQSDDVVPEPATLTLIGFGLLAISLRRRT